MNTLGIYGASFRGIASFQQGLLDILPNTQIIHIGTGPLPQYLDLAGAWIYLHEEGIEYIPALLEKKKPAVCRSLPLLELGLPVVHIDDESAARQLAEHQISRGVRSLHYWGIPLTFSHRRSSGVRAAAEAAGLPFTESLDLSGTVTALSDAVKDGPAGFVGMNDEWCYRVASALHGSDLQIPRDILLAGFDNLATPPEPWGIPLTTCIFPLREQGRLAAALISSAKAIPLKVHLAPPSVILKRESTCGTS